MNVPKVNSFLILSPLLFFAAVVGPAHQIQGQTDTEAGSVLPPQSNTAAKGTKKSVQIKIQLPDAHNIHLVRKTNGTYYYDVQWSNGRREQFTPQAFSDYLFQDHHNRRFGYRILNISSPIGFAWVSVGLLGQVLFTGRMIVQWLTSERVGRSVVPVAFWWLSLAGATMLIIYFSWRRDAVGILGQSVGWLIYTRNLWMIYYQRRDDQTDEIIS